jgi:hypothetical protein
MEVKEDIFSYIPPFPDVSTVGTQCYIPFTILVARWHCHMGNLKNLVGKNAFRILNSFSLSHMNDLWCTKIIIDKTQHLKEKNWRKGT